MSEWKEIKTIDDLPKDDEFCLIVRKGGRYVEMLCWNQRHQCWDDSEGDDYDCDPLDIGFWMPVPMPPFINNHTIGE